MTIPHDDRRKEERYATPNHVDCTFASPVLEDFGKVKITSISRSGIGLHTTDEVAEGMLLAVKLENATKNFTKTLLVRVVHVTPRAGGSFLIGGTLDTPLTYEELCAFIM